jgi:hypothetical protein
MRANFLPRRHLLVKGRAHVAGEDRISAGEAPLVSGIQHKW